MTPPPVITAEGLGKRYRIGGQATYGRLTESLTNGARRLARRTSAQDREAGHLWAIRDVSLEIGEGEVVGLVGRNGAGKSTLLKVLSRITEPTAGRAELRGRVGSLLEVGTGFHPELTGRENVYLNGAILGMRKAEIDRRFDEIVAFAEIEAFLDTPVKRYSSGMYMRLAFAVAAHLEPEILIVDEVLAVGDAAFQRKCLGKMDEVADAGRTVVFVSHNMAAIQSLCRRAYLLDGGRVVSEGPARDVVQGYLESLASSLSIPLSDRQDRRGDGAARITGIEVESLDADGVIRTGSRLRVTLRYSSNAELVRPRFLVSIYDSSRTGVYMLDSDSGPGLPETLPESGTVVCITDPITVTPGRCYLNVSLMRGLVGGLSDFVDNAGAFDVEPEDLYSLGPAPPRDWALMVLNQRWLAPDRAETMLLR